jgi:hypothetical protein
MSFYKKKDFLLKRVKDLYFIVNQKKGTIVNLNEVSFFIWNCLDKPLDVAGLVGLLTTEYDVNESEAKSDIEDFLEIALKSGIIDKVK